jgi:hypothetical protein
MAAQTEYQRGYLAGENSMRIRAARQVLGTISDMEIEEQEMK